MISLSLCNLKKNHIVNCISVGINGGLHYCVTSVSSNFAIGKNLFFFPAQIPHRRLVS